MSKDRPNTAVAEVRCDRRVLASIAVYYTKQGQKPNSTSDLLRAIIYNYYDLLLKHEIVTEINSTTEATEIMNELKFENLNRSGRGLQALSKQISKESIAEIDETSAFMAKLNEIEINESFDI